MHGKEPIVTAMGGVAENLGTDEAKGIVRMSPNVITIEQAIEQFAEQPPEVYADDTELAKWIRRERSPVKIPNSNYLHGIGLCDAMFKNALKSCRILAGGGEYSFTTYLQTTFRAMLDRFKHNNGEAKIIVLGGKTDLMMEFESEFPEVFQVATATATRPLKHFIVCDDDMVRDEEEHEAIKADTPIDAIRADVYFSNPSMASDFIAIFDAYWNKLAKTE